MVNDQLLIELNYTITVYYVKLLSGSSSQKQEKTIILNIKKVYNDCLKKYEYDFVKVLFYVT